LTLVLRILIKNEKSGLCSSLKKRFGKLFEKKRDLIFLEVNLTRTGLAPTYLMVENQGSRSSKRHFCLKKFIFLYFENFVFFWCFLNYLKMCHTTWAIVKTLKEKENYFIIFENECHAVRATGQTQ